MCFFFFQAEDGIRDAQESRGLGDVYKRQRPGSATGPGSRSGSKTASSGWPCDTYPPATRPRTRSGCCLLYTSDAADEEDSVDLGGRRIIKKKKKKKKTKKKKKKNK